MSAPKKSVVVNNVDQSQLVVAAAAFLKKSGKLSIPEFSDLTKTGTHKELGPVSPDWYFIRCAAVARHVYVRSPVGVGALTKIFGGKKNNGCAPGHWRKGSPGLARRSLQSLEAFKWLEKDPNGGRKLTSQGRRDLDRIAAQVNAKAKRAAKLEAFRASQA